MDTVLPAYPVHSFDVVGDGDGLARVFPRLDMLLECFHRAKLRGILPRVVGTGVEHDPHGHGATEVFRELPIRQADRISFREVPVQGAVDDDAPDACGSSEDDSEAAQDGHERTARDQWDERLEQEGDEATLLGLGARRAARRLQRSRQQAENGGQQRQGEDHAGQHAEGREEAEHLQLLHGRDGQRSQPRRRGE
jgi:hypothetical protein